jgi:membrane protein YdbS with pleckstrin-like domain
VLPAEIGQLTGLRELWLDDNQLTAPSMSLIFPAGQFRMLGTIFRGQLTGRWPGLGSAARSNAGRCSEVKGSLACPSRFDLRRGTGMRLAPNTDTVPASVNKYLLPHERQVVSVHQHPAVLIRPILEVLIGLAIAGWVSSSIAHGNNTVILVIWILWALLLLRLLWKVFEWSENYFIITSQRLLLSEGFLTHKVNMMPLTKVTDMTFRRSAMGRLLGYGEFIVESAGQNQALRIVDHLPYPEQLYLEVCGLIFKEREESTD